MSLNELKRVDANRLELINPYGIDVTLFANEEVPIEPVAVAELQAMLQLQETIEDIYKACPKRFSVEPVIESVAITPDFHKARGIPVGTILETSGFLVPQAIGNDINCGMRLHRTSLTADQLKASVNTLEIACRSIFFEAGRRIPLAWPHREALLLSGIEGLYATVDKTFDEGLWSYFHRTDRDETLARIERRGCLSASRVHGLEDFLGHRERLHRDSQIGSIGGGNHFVEFQKVERILDGQIAHAWGLEPGMVTIMVHTGSVSVGYASGSFYRDQVRLRHPTSVRRPQNGIDILPIGPEDGEAESLFWDSMNNAANFAYANRMFLALMAWASLENCFGETRCELLYDAPHNMIWKEQSKGYETYIHRKGACPARGFDAMAGTPFAYYGEPVLVPGSMGASSYVLAGNGFPGTNQSAAHGAGRAISRGASMKGFDREFQQFLEEFRVVTPVDFRRQDIRQRSDIRHKKLADLRQEAPFAYKGIGSVIETIQSSGMARPVAELKPLMTVKG
ncbi:RNA-splicing ligase RtcB [Blastopirellula marina]|uniref:tRNA-splicing ligase RtcB n=1 Tax=Blastopirellula marina TaxID=124 RepID=A0A2S8FU51_9BACT|nr:MULTISPECIES: RtcB family protein [Pirellulaceae]PQO35708.1 RNA-splicing ligase RtcB [Blastopirellula marina]RCS53282.1 RtcB family protein [Bremerella cremea]